MDIFEQMDIALAESYREGFTAGVKLTCEELLKIFVEISGWGSDAAAKVVTFLELYKTGGDSVCKNQEYYVQ